MSGPRAKADCECPHCGARVDAAAAECWLCRQKVTAGAGVASPARADPNREAGLPAATADAHAHFQFSLASLMLLVTLTAVMMGVSVMAPGLGAALALVAAPAVVRTVIIAGRRRAGGKPLGIGDKAGLFARSLWLFVGTLLLVGVVAVAAWAAFLVTCFPLGLAAFGARLEGLVVVAYLVGTAAGLLVAFFLGRVVWKVVRAFWKRNRGGVP